MGKKLKFKKMWNLVLSKPENHELRHNTPIKIYFEFSRKKKYSFIADTKLQIDKVRKNWRRSSISHFLFKNKILLKVKTTISFQVTN